MQAPAEVVAQSEIARVASLTAWILIFLALVVLFAWAPHISSPTGVVSGWTAMKPNAAAAFFFAGLALLRREHRDSISYSLVVLLIGTLTLIEYLSRSDLGFDQLLFRDPYSATDPGRMSQITSVGFVLLGAALALTRSRSERRRGIGRGLALAAGTLGAVALLGYSYDTQALYRVRPYTSVALHTAIAFVVAAIGLHCTTPAEGLVHQIRADNAGGEMLRRLLPAALLIPYLLGFAAWIAHEHLGWEMGFTLALIVAATMLCLALIMLLNAKHLAREDLARRRIHQALKERTVLLAAREELLNIFVKHAPAAVAMFDRDMRYLQVSDRWCADFGLDSSQILGRSHYEIFSDIPQRWKEIHRRCLAGETLKAEADRWEHADGITWLHWEAVPWGKRGDGLPEGILIFSEDITAPRQAEVERQKFVSLADHSAEFIGMCDMDFKPFYVNPAGRRLVGLDSLEQAGAVRVQDFFFPEDQPFISNEFFPKVLREGQGEVEVRFRHFKTGGALWMIYNVFQIMGESGQPVGYATVSRDITARKLAEEALRGSEERLRLAQRAAHAGTWEWDLRTNENSWSEELWPLYGLEPHSCRPSFAAWLDSVHPDDRDGAAGAVRSAAAAEAELNVEWRVHRRDGGEVERWLGARGEPQRDASGQVVRYLGIALDITERKQAEQQLAAELDAMTRLQKLGTLFVREGNLGPILGEIVEAAIAIAGADFGNIQLWDARSGQLRMAAQRGFPQWWVEFWNHVSEGRVTCGTALERGERVIVEDVEQSPVFAAAPALQVQLRAGVRAVQSTPLMSRTGKLLGMFSTHYKKPHRPDEYALRRLDLLARQAADIIERAQGEEALRNRESTIRTLLETASQAILAVGRNGTIVLANRMAEDMFGYGANELVGKMQEGLLPERLREVHALHRAEFHANPSTRPMGSGLELCGRRKDGSEFPVDVSLSSIDTDQGRLAVGFVTDITARKQAEAALRNREEQLRVLAGSLLTAQEDERRRLSRELHDDVTQRLALLSIELGKLAAQIPSSLSEMRASVRALQEQTLQASTEVRRLSRGLHPSVIEDFGLSVALEEFCGEFGKAQGVRVSFEGLIDDSRLDHACATCLYRITQESLRNAVVHGRATEVLVTLSLGPKTMELRVRDNGVGFLAEGTRTKRGLGVVSMQERIRLVKGTLMLSSQPGQGTEIIASVPLLEVGNEKLTRPAG